MDHGSSSSKAKRAFRFIQDEVKQMEEKLKPRTTSHPDRVLMRELALKFSESQGRVGTTPVTPKQVHVVVLRIGFSFSGRDPKFLSNSVSIRSALGNLCCPHAGPQLVSLPPLLQEQQEGSCHESAAAGDGDPSRPAAIPNSSATRFQSDLRWGTCAHAAGAQLVSLPLLQQGHQQGSKGSAAAAACAVEHDGVPSRPSAAKRADRDWARPSARCRILVHCRLFVDPNYLPVIDDVLFRGIVWCVEQELVLFIHGFCLLVSQTTDRHFKGCSIDPFLFQITTFLASYPAYASTQ